MILNGFSYRPCNKIIGAIFDAGVFFARYLEQNTHELCESCQLNLLHIDDHEICFILLWTNEALVSP